jgi:hypothetical protein
MCFICLFFQDAITANGDLGKRITYLKVDVEGSELKSISEWITSGILDDVRQIGIEIHTAQDFVVKEQVEKISIYYGYNKSNYFQFFKRFLWNKLLVKLIQNEYSLLQHYKPSNKLNLEHF